MNKSMPYNDEEFEEVKNLQTEEKDNVVLFTAQHGNILWRLIATVEQLKEENKEVEHEISFIEDLNTKLLEANTGWREENAKLRNELQDYHLERTERL